jgi:predicted GNAT family N-acyltransferase
MKMVKLEIEYGTPDYHDTVNLRNDLLRIPLNLEFTTDQLSAEYDSYHLGVYNEALTLVGCLVLKPLSKSIVKMRQVAVKADFQSKGIGTTLVKYSEAFAKKKGFTKMELNARDVAIPFYERQAYKKIGEPFEEVGIKHFKMVKDLI